MDRSTIGSRFTARTGGCSWACRGFTSKPVDDPDHTMIPQFSFDAEPLGEGTLDTIVRIQTLLSWLALGLLFSILSGVIKKD